MANIVNRYEANVAGKFYVDTQCIDCDLCRETAPANFKRHGDGGYSFVFKQPTTPDEEAQCREAMEACPVEAIGNNGGDLVESNENGELPAKPQKCAFTVEGQRIALFNVEG